MYHLWHVASGIIKGDYEVLSINPTKNDQGYILYFRTDSKEQYEDEKRIASLQKISEIAGKSVLRIPPATYREFEFAMFDAAQKAVLKGINEKLMKQFAILISSNSVELEEINEYVKWLKSTIMTTLDTLDTHERQRDRYKVFFDSVIFKYLDKLHSIAIETLKEKPKNEFFRDILFEAHLVTGQLIDENHEEKSVVDKFEDSWKTLAALLKNPPPVQNDEDNNDSGQPMTAFLYSSKTPVSGEAKPPRKSREIVKVVKPRVQTVMGVTSQEAMGKTKPKPAPVPKSATSLKAIDFGENDADATTDVDQVKAAVANDQTDVQIILEGSPEELRVIKSVERETRGMLGSADLRSAQGIRDLDKQFKEIVVDRLVTPAIRKAFISTILFFINNIKDNPSFQGKERPLWIYLRGLLSKLMSDHKSLPTNNELNELKEKIPNIEHFPHLKMIAEKLKIEGIISNPLYGLRKIIDEEIGCLRFHINTEQTSRVNPYDQEAFERLRNVIYTKLTDFDKVKKRLKGRFGTRLIRRMMRSKNENEQIAEYLNQMEEFLSELKQKALDPTFENIQAIYYPSSPENASQT